MFITIKVVFTFIGEHQEHHIMQPMVGPKRTSMEKEDDLESSNNLELLKEH